MSDICDSATTNDNKISNGEVHTDDFASLIPKTSIGMKKLDKSLFNIKVTLPVIKCDAKSCGKFLSACKLVLLKRAHFRKVVADSSIGEGKRLVLLDQSINSIDRLSENIRELIVKEDAEFCKHCLMLNYKDFSFNEIIQSILPEEMEEGISSFETVGHIAHVNLKPHLHEYKYIIGEVLLDKNVHVKTVVNKTNTIEETFRFFKMELLAGENKTFTSVSENGCTYEFDYSQVYWNSRLQSEHHRLVEQMKPRDLIFDVFAGVGPFSIPAAKQGCIVYANDLNKECYKALLHNAQLNKVGESINVLNMDGRDFMKDIIIEKHLNNRHNHKSSGEPVKIHIIMNLPAVAPQFLDVFREKYAISDIHTKVQTDIIIHCYCFSKSSTPKIDARMIVEDALGFDISSSASTHFVRRVAPKKVMLCVSFNMPWFEGNSENCSDNSSTSLFTRKRTLEGDMNPMTIVKSMKSDALSSTE